MIDSIGDKLCSFLGCGVTKGGVGVFGENSPVALELEVMLTDFKLCFIHVFSFCRKVVTSVAACLYSLIHSVCPVVNLVRIAENSWHMAASNWEA